MTADLEKAGEELSKHVTSGALHEECADEVLAHLAVQLGIASDEHVATVSSRRREQMDQVTTAGGVCGQCKVCKDHKLEGPQLHVSPKLTKIQGAGVAMNEKKIKKHHDKVCLMVQAMRVSATGKAGLVMGVGQEAYVWHGERRGSPDGEWFLGKVVAFYPRSAACYMEFSKVDGDGGRTRVQKYDDCVQGWRGDEKMTLSTMRP